MKQLRLTTMWAPWNYWYIIPTIKVCIFEKEYDVAWTIDFLWLRLYITLAKYRKQE